jgi:hypothetical protein
MHWLMLIIKRYSRWITPPRGGSGAGLSAFLIFHSTIPVFDADDGGTIPEYTGLIAYSGALEHGVLQLDD